MKIINAEDAEGAEDFLVWDERGFAHSQLPR